MIVSADGWSVRAVREYYGLDAPREISEYARRPVCRECGARVGGHSFYHLGTGVVCHGCLLGTRHGGLAPQAKQPKRVNRNGWDGYTRPSHACLDCEKMVMERRALRCLRCAAKERERKRKEARMAVKAQGAVGETGQTNFGAAVVSDNLEARPMTTGGAREAEEDL